MNVSETDWDIVVLMICAMPAGITVILLINTLVSYLSLSEFTVSLALFFTLIFSYHVWMTLTLFSTKYLFK